MGPFSGKYTAAQTDHTQESLHQIRVCDTIIRVEVPIKRDEDTVQDSSA